MVEICCFYFYLSVDTRDILNELGAQQGKLDADLRTSALLGTSSVQSVHDYYSFVVEDGADLRLWRLRWLIAWLFWWPFVASIA
jgi:hypothetical protein